MWCFAWTARPSRSLRRQNVNTRSLSVSAIGRGKGVLDGAGDVTADIFFDGVWSLNDEPYKSLPDDPTPFELVAPPTG